MSIGVQSSLELYTLLMGWDLYDKLWTLLTETGLAYLPFIGMILRNVAESYTAHRDTGGMALRTMEINLIVTLLLILVAVSPAIPLSTETIAYSPLCSTDQNEPYHAGKTGTTYDKAFFIPTEPVKIPIVWYGVISLSEGITHAANTMVGCVPNLRKMITGVSMTKISDPEMKQELQDFAMMCYVPARTRFNQDQLTKHTENLERIQTAIKGYGVEDTEWLGSHSFSEVYYPTLTASHPVPGFEYHFDEDVNADVNKENPPPYGTPSCQAWWNDKEHGLHDRLYQILPKSFLEEFKNYLGDTKTQDDVVKQIIYQNANGFDNANNTIGDYGYSHLAAATGLFLHQFEEYPKLYAASQAAPILQALLLLLMYVFLPFAFVFSSYRTSTFITGSLLIFSVIFWGFIWHLVSWIDSALMQALYSGWFVKQGAGATLADMIIASLVIFAPLFWFSFMGAMGVAIGDIANTFSMGTHDMTKQAARKGSSAIKNIAQKIAPKAKQAKQTMKRNQKDL
jgi:hypothetical protein